MQKISFLSIENLKSAICLSTNFNPIYSMRKNEKNILVASLQIYNFNSYVFLKQILTLFMLREKTARK